MKIRDEITHSAAEMCEWRRDIHAHPEIAFEEDRTPKFVAEKLESFGIKVHRGLARTGVVGTLSVGSSNRAIGLRADLDALEIQEQNTFDYVSRVPGKMHACGHDGHTAMLLGAAKYLASTRRFNGTVQFIFQPAEENEAVGRLMCSDGLFDLFPVGSVFGMHNQPGLPIAKFAVCVGPCFASADMFEITISGKGSHAAHPHHGMDPIVTGAEIIIALQRLISRGINPIESAVISVTQIHAGTNMNVIPGKVVIRGTSRALNYSIQDSLEEGIRQLVDGIVLAYGQTAEVVYDRRYPNLVNSPEETSKAISAAVGVVGEENVITNLPPTMGSEDFAWMLQERPGCYIRVGNGEGKDGGCVVHNPNYDFNDTAAVYGASYWAQLVEQELSID